jgi:hypothetical protein
MSVKNEWPTANINFAVVIQKSVVIFLCRAIFLVATVLPAGRLSSPAWRLPRRNRPMAPPASQGGSPFWSGTAVSATVKIRVIGAERQIADFLETTCGFPILLLSSFFNLSHTFSSLP